MNRAEVIDLMIEIKEEYPTFDVSEEEIERHYKRLKDFPLAAALKNVDDHVKTNKYFPKISDIRGCLGDQLDSQRSKEQAAAHEANMNEWAKIDSPPPDGYWETMRTRLRGEQFDS
ncbi:hypothetical protein [Paenibacillus eucommiae]|uniref:Replicative helicase inhibitor G39P N-terminal domain-containing protein n=1 Tax=Paenibacillus eucommiae TaxID=1355755 RepID=A0ABS4IY65_9BACL|nr:hypothetical protein [Paenibacillus eucommiae]MBP1992526.1 hypothetical protein [Paenibacillus eucommiae]